MFHKKIFDAVLEKPKPVQALFKTMLAANGFFRDTFKINLGKKLFGKVHESFGNNLRFAITAGSRFDETVAEDFYKLGFTIIQHGLRNFGAATALTKTTTFGRSQTFFNAEVNCANQIGKIHRRSLFRRNGFQW